MHSRCFALAVAAALCSRGITQEAERRAHDLFTSSEQCALCHLVAPGATAMQTADGDDVSPYGLWQGTMMANAFRDPYFRATLQKETAVAGEQVQELCLRCHAPMASHGAVLAGRPAPRLHDVEGDLYADDGVSCTVCHLITDKGLGDESTFSGRPVFGTQRRIYGPFADVMVRPMQNMVRYTPTHGAHVRTAALCAVCHTLYTEHHGKAFPEQTPFLEWRNSQYNDEQGAGDTTRTCQQCHMPKAGPTRIARSPMGFDFRIPEREEYRAHAFVGGNAFMLDVLRQNADELSVTAEPQALARMAEATREQLAERTARLSISAIARDRDSGGTGGIATFAVSIENLAGHKFPTGYPARRAWLHVRVLLDGKLVFESGATDAEGRLTGVESEHRLPHVRTVEKPGDVAVYEMIAADPDGAPTTLLTHMVTRLKDNRLLPRGWRADGPHVADTAPVGTDGDDDFTAGGDTVHFRITLPDGAKGRLQVAARLLYQSVPPRWVDPLRSVDAEEARLFVRLYDEAKKVPEKVANAVRDEQ